MPLKEAQIRENLSMDNHHNSAANPPSNVPNTIVTSSNSPTFTARRGYFLSTITLVLIGAFFVCTLLAVSLIIYNFTTCEQQITPLANEQIVCKTVKKKPLPGAAEDEQPDYERDVRLPRSVIPLKYNLTVVPYLQEGNFSFDGKVKIRVRVLEDCYNITMHANELNITHGNVRVQRVAAADPRELRIRKQYMYEPKQFFIIELYDKLEKNVEYEIRIVFAGLIQDYLQGFYRSSYKVGNETRWLASTQFQATDARRAFPCFDEPALKAKFTLNIARPRNLKTVSNMPIVKTRKHETLPGYMWDHFAESVPMSTYLLAYAITDFSHLSKGNFSVWARSNAIQAAEYALSVGPKILGFLEQFFNVTFPLPKIDMIALPDFQAGAMENWGLITYRETTMLFEQGVSATTVKQRIASVVGHELAHQWFGNLVTPSWWSDLWLNEGFASYMEYITVNAIEPGWNNLDQFVVNELQNVFNLDALSTSHKISVEVFNPDEISEIFDRISYAKGSAIIRMMSHFLTSDVFRRGLSKYLTEMAYSSATQDDLWHFLTMEATASGLLDKSITVKKIMDTWTLQMGYPVLKVSRHPHIVHLMRLEQQRFLYVNKTSNEDDDKEARPLWWIPITYTTSKELNFYNTRPVTWVPRTKVYEFENGNLSTAKWFIFNIQQTGYYRVNYDLDNWQAITSHLWRITHFRQIAPANRAQLIDDSMNLARAGYLPYSVPLNMTRYLVNEYDYVPWKAAITAFNFIDSMFVNQGDYDLLKNYLLHLIENVYNEVGFSEDGDGLPDMLKLFKRAEILNIACHLGHEGCISECSRQFQNWLQTPNPDRKNPISPNFRSMVYCVAIKYGSEAEWDFAYERYLKTTVSTEKELLLSALGCSKEPWLLFRYLRRSISSSAIRKQDLYRIFAAVSTNVIGRQIAFDFIRTNWEEVKAYMGSSMSNFNMILKFITKNMNSQFHLSELQTFVKNDLKDNSRVIQQLVEQVSVNVDWMKRNYKPIVEWLRKEQGEGRKKRKS